MNVLLVGEESAGIQTLRALARSPHRVIGVMASPSKQTIGEATVWAVAQRLGYPVWPAGLVKDPAFADEVRGRQVDLILNVHSLYRIHPDVLDAARVGGFNMHPGPLPHYAGLNTVSWAIYRGERAYGVTVHKMVAGIDAGPIVYQASFPIDDDDTALSLYSKCLKAGLPLILQLLDTASTAPDALPLIPQDLTKRVYFGKGTPEQGRLTWSRPAREVVNLVRACDYFPFPSPWGYPRARRNGDEIAIAKASLTGRRCDAAPGTVEAAQSTGVTIACADEWLCLHTVILNGQRVDAVEVLKPSEQLS